MTKIYKLSEMPASSQEYYSEKDTILVKYVGSTTADYINGRYYKSVYAPSTQTYGWAEATEHEYFIKVLTKNNLIYILQELTSRLRDNHLGE